MLRPLALAAVATTLFIAGPAMARENCDMNGTRPGLTVEFGISIGGKKGGDGDSFNQDIVKMELRKRGVTAKIVFMSGHAEDAFARNLPAGEDFGFLPKPFPLKQLIETVKAAMG